MPAAAGPPLVPTHPPAPPAPPAPPQVTRARHDVRLVPAAAMTWAAAWWGSAVPAGSSRVAAVTVVGAGVLVAVALLVRGRMRTDRAGPRLSAHLHDVATVLVLVCACVGSVLGLVSWQQERRSPPVVSDLADRSGTTVAEVVVVGDPVTGRGEAAWQQSQVQVRVVLVVVDGAQGRRVVRVPALLSGDEAWLHAAWGQRVRVPLALARAPAGAPFAVFARAVGAGELVREPAWWWRGADRLRTGLLTAATVEGRTDAAVLLPGLVVGDTSAQPPDLVEDMQTAGLSHLSAVSGTNVTIVCGGVLLLGVLVRAGRRTRAVLAGVALLALVVVARPEPSVLRAAVMGAVGLLGLLLGRRGGGLSALAVAVLGVVLVDPWLARAPGFRLSVVATAALVVLAGPWARALGRVLPRSLAFVLAVPAAAQVAVTPVLVGLDDRVSLYALPANVLAAPAVAPATVVGLLAALVSLVHPGAAALVAVPALWCTGWVAGVARTAADLPAAALPWPAGRTGLVLAIIAPAVVVAVAALVLRRLPDRRATGRPFAPWPAPPRLPGHTVPPRQVSWPSVATATRAGMAAAVALLLLAVWWLPRGPSEAWPGTGWAVVVCDVDQGESVLLRTGPDSAVVVDTGPEPAAVAGCLRRAGVRTVPLLVLTHLHADHVGGLTGVSGQARVLQAWTAPSGMPAAAEEGLQRWSTETGVPLHRPVAGDGATVGRARVDVLAPQRTASAPGPGTGDRGGDSQDVNDAGLVVRVSTGGLVVLAVGDVGSQAQQRLLAAGVGLRADVTTVAHHGSADQLPAFWAAVGARVAVASAGRDNDYGHPSPRAMSVLSDAGALVLSTAAHGDVALRPVPTGQDGTGQDGTGQDGTGQLPGPVIGVRTTRSAPRRARCPPQRAGRVGRGRSSVPA